MFIIHDYGCLTPLYTIFHFCL